jgi:hypothetical protein
MMKPFLQKAAKWLGLLVGVAVVLFAALKLYFDAAYFSGYEPAAPLNVEIAVPPRSGCESAGHCIASGNESVKLGDSLVSPDFVRVLE